MEFKCSICGAQFYHKRYLTDHHIRVHGMKSRCGQLPCTACSEVFSSKVALKKHVLTHKKNGHAQSTVQCQEENCETFFRTVCDLRKHLVDLHKIQEIGIFQKLDLENYFAFNQWLSQEEKNTNSKFVISNKKQMKDYRYVNFVCSRSGTYKPKSDDPERQLKAQGSKKLGFYCTATIQVKEYKDNVSIIYYDVHYNHDDSFAHIPVPETDKDIIAGRPSLDENHPDYAPNVFSFSRGKISWVKNYEKCLQKTISLPNEKEKIKEEECEASTSKEPEIIIPDIADQVEIDQTSAAETSIMDNLIAEKERLRAEIEKLTSDTASEINMLKEEIKILNEKLRFSDFATLLLNEKKQFVFYTGVPDIKVFNWILSTAVKFVEETFSIANEKQLLIVLVKLRWALHDQDIAVRFQISQRTVRRILHAWLPVLADHLKHLIFWPGHKAIQRNIPHCFKNSLYNDTACIFDCAEILTQRPSNSKIENQMWSNYDQDSTVKFLIAATPLGQICYVSDICDGSISDKEIILESDILNYLKPGDVVLANRDFNVAPEFDLKGVKIIVPCCTEEEEQLNQKEDVLTSKQNSDVWIHAERVFGHIKNFKVLTDIIPVATITYLDCITRICASIQNLWPAPGSEFNNKIPQTGVE